MADIVIKTKLLDNTEVVWDKRWIKSIETNVQSTSDPSAIQYGAIDSSGSAKIIDIDSSIYQNIINGNLKKDNLDIQIYLNGKQVRNHIVTDSNYDKNTNILSLTFQGLFYKLAQEDYAGVSLNVNKTAYELTSKVLSDFGYTGQQIQEALSNNIVVGDYTMESIENYLKSIVIPYSFIKRDGKKIDAINEICKLAQLQAFEDDNGNIKFMSARPSFSKSSETVNVINANCQYSPFDSAIILKNKIGSVGYKSNNSYISAKKVESLSINTYDQTNSIGNVTVNNETKQYYSGLLSDYESNITYDTTKENGFYIFGNYPISGEDYNDKDRALVCKYTFDSNQYILDDSVYEILGQYQAKKAIFIPMRTMSNMNKIAFNSSISFSEQNKYALQYTSSSEAINTEFDDYTLLAYSPTFADSEAEALSELCNMSGGNIVSVKPVESIGDLGRFIQIVKNGNEYTCYFCIYDITEHQLSTSVMYNNYSGDLREILLNFNLSTFIRCLIESYTDVDAGSDFILPQGYLFHSNATVDGNNLYNSAKQDILTDYADGISNGTTTISFADYYDINGTKTKNKNNGEVFKIGDLVRVDRDNSGHSAREYANESPMIWRVVGRKIRKDNGVVFIDLNLSECKARSAQEYTLLKGISNVTRTYSPSGATLGELTNADTIYEGDELSVAYTSAHGIRTYSISMAGEIIESGSDVQSVSYSLTVSGDVVVTITPKQQQIVENILYSSASLSYPYNGLKQTIASEMSNSALEGKEIAYIAIDADYYNQFTGQTESFINRLYGSITAGNVQTSWTDVFGSVAQGKTFNCVQLTLYDNMGGPRYIGVEDGYIDPQFVADSIYVGYDNNYKWYIQRNYYNYDSVSDYNYYTNIRQVKVFTREYV